MRSECLVFVQTGHTQVQLEADQRQAEGDHRILEIKTIKNKPQKMLDKYFTWRSFAQAPS